MFITQCLTDDDNEHSDNWPRIPTSLCSRWGRILSYAAAQSLKSTDTNSVLIPKAPSVISTTYQTVKTME